MDKPYKWIQRLSVEELRTYPADRIIVGYDRLDDKPITLDEVYVVKTIDSSVQRS